MLLGFLMATAIISLFLCVYFIVQFFVKLVLWNIKAIQNFHGLPFDYLGFAIYITISLWLFIGSMFLIVKETL